MLKNGQRPESYDVSAQKRPAHLSVNSDLLEKAERMGIDLSQVLEEALAERLCSEPRQHWIDENRDGIEAYNRRIETRGSYGDQRRRF
jgi:post-segregation antitoxin (ccd killing protein)